MRKELKTLISWCKKYLDCDATLRTTIEENEVLIENQLFDDLNNIQMTVEYNNKLVAVFHFDTEEQKWKKQN